MAVTAARLKGGRFRTRNKNPNILEGIAAIAAFIGKSPNTTTSWILNHGLPATKTPEGLWYTHKALILQWIYAGWRAEVTARNGSFDNDARLDHKLGDMLEEENLDDLSDKLSVKASEHPL